MEELNEKGMEARRWSHGSCVGEDVLRQICENVMQNGTFLKSNLFMMN